MLKEECEIKVRLNDQELDEMRIELFTKYGNDTYRHRNGQHYIIQGVTIINMDRTAYWGFIYSKSTESGATKPLSFKHTRPVYEFLDGRFTTVS